MAKVLIDLGTEGQPQSGDTLPEGGAKINQHINDVYAAFSPKVQAPENQIIHGAGVYQSVSYDDVISLGADQYEYHAALGSMIVIDMQGDVHVYLPAESYPGSQIKIFKPHSQPGVITVHAPDGQTIQNSASVNLITGVQYQFIALLDYINDGFWSQRIIETKVSDMELVNNPEPVFDSGTLTIDCSSGKYFKYELTSNITNLNFINTPSNGEAITIILELYQGNSSYTCQWFTAGGYWSTNNYDTSVVDGIALLALTFISGNQFNTLVNNWFALV